MWSSNAARWALPARSGRFTPAATRSPALNAIAPSRTCQAAPDASFIGVNRELTIDIVRQLRDRGAGGAVCFASGFSESEAEAEGGTQLQARLIEAAGEMPVLGPNCYGFINYLDGALLWPDQHGGARVERGVAILTQSSNIAINMTMQRRGLPLAFVITAGNQAQTSQAAMAMAMVADPRITAIGLHIEGVGSVRELEALADAARNGRQTHRRDQGRKVGAGAEPDG